MTGITISLGPIPILRYPPPALFRNFHHHLIPLPHCYIIVVSSQNGNKKAISYSFYKNVDIFNLWLRNEHQP
ncbi:hypothetical protein, partial [Klebsiella pneumoniae]|uniref:hypothetical protein n=1 Tax=Klebsiella pneumoniae TaxID=573 RepID=UPI0019529CCD